MNRQAVRSLHVAKRIPRSQVRREKVKNEIMEFAGKLRPNFVDKGCAAFHVELSTITSRMATSEMQRFKKSIQKGKQDSLFPVSAVMSRKGKAAEQVADFLGEEYVDNMLGIARSCGNIHNVAVGKQYLEWASEYGEGKIKARALAGVAKVAADEVAQGNGDFIEREMIKNRGIMKVLSKHVGGKNAWKIVKEQLREEQAAKKVAAIVSFMAGVCVAAAHMIIQSLPEMKEAGAMPIAVMGTSAITGIVAGLSFLGTINMGMLQRRIGKLLKAEEHV